MKKSILFLVLLQSLLIFAQAPQKMTYQSVVRNSANVLLANQAVGVRISILEGSLSGTAVYSETHAVTTNANGLFTLEAGGGTPTEGVFADIVWGNGAHYIKSEIDPTGGTNYTLSATKELLSVPYALNGITSAQADAIAAQASTITAMQTQIAAMQAQITTLDAAVHPTITNGNQFWQNTNLDLSTYSDGTVIPEVQDASEWASLTTGAWCYYNNDVANGAIYGKLYNWYAVAGIYNEASKTDTNQRKKLAPTGYHVPSDSEWMILTTYLGGVGVAGDKMKETGTANWISPNQEATNSSGFTGLPGGYRDDSGPFNPIGYYGYWWSSSEYDMVGAWNRHLNSNTSAANRYSNNKAYGFSVRCLKDEVGYIMTNAVANITATTVTSGGTIASDGGATITQRGVVWSISANPTIALATKTTDGSGMGSFTSTITGLTPATNYHLRAYATNSAGTSYGAEVSFTTPAGDLPPDMGGSGGFGLPDTGGSSGSGGSAGPNIGN